MFDLALPDRKHTERSPHLRLPAEPSGAVLPPGGALEPLHRQPSVISFAVLARLLRDTGFWTENGVSRTENGHYGTNPFRDTGF